MERSSFLMMLLAAAPLMALASQQKDAKGFKVKSGEARYHGHIRLKGVNANMIDVKVSGLDTNGALAIFEQTSVSPNRGTPMHLHHHQDEIFFVQDGQYYFQVGDDKHYLSTGDTIFLPRNVPHAWTQISDKGKMTVMVQPAGQLENFFLTMAALDAEPSKELISKIFAANGMEVVGPPLQLDKSEHEK